MPLYEYRCRSCDTVFELRREMAAANDPAACPDGHEDSVRLLSSFAATGLGASSSKAAPVGPAPCGANTCCPGC